MIKIIGGSGFIGTRLSKRLTLSKKEFGIVDKYRVRVLLLTKIWYSEQKRS